MIRQKEGCRELVRPDWVVARGGMWNVNFHTTTVICQEEGAVKETVSVRVCVVCVCILASCEELCRREKNNYHTPSSRNCSLHRRERNSDAPTTACRPDGHLQSRPSRGCTHLCRWHVSHGGRWEEENETRYVHNKEFILWNAPVGSDVGVLVTPAA